MSKRFFSSSLLCLGACLTAQVGIQTSQIDPSAMLEVNTGSLASGSKKGFLGPRINLTSSRDVQTIPSPAVGLLVYNLSTSGTFPDDVHPNRYYYWNGTEWVDFGVNTVLENFLAYRMMSLNATESQTFAYNDINSTSAANGGIPVSFADSNMIVNTGNIATKTGNTFRINITGLYEISGYVNYNPNRTSIGSPQRGCFPNLKLQLSSCMLIPNSG